MSYDISTRLDYLGDRMQELNVTSLTYLRGEESVEIENFTPQKVDVDELAAFGISLITEKLQDFTFYTSKLEDLDPPLPIRNDKILWNGRVFEAFSINEEIYRFTTSTRKRIRVHTRQIE